MTFVTLRLVGEDAKIGWEKAGAYLYPAIAHSGGLYEPEDVRALVTNPDSGWSLWIIAEGTDPLGCWTSQVKYFPRGRALEIAFAGGRGMKRWYEVALGASERFARDMGCDRLRCCGREGWKRFGYKPAGLLFERKFT